MRLVLRHQQTEQTMIFLSEKNQFLVNSFLLMGKKQLRVNGFFSVTTQLFASSGQKSSCV